MVKSKFAQFIDMILFIIGFSLISFAWINKYIKITWLSFIIVSLFSFIIAKLIWSKNTKKYNRAKLKNAELQYGEACINHLALHPDQTIPLFKKIITESVKNGNFLCKNDNLYYFDYSSEKTTTEVITKILNKLKHTKKQKCYLFTSALTDKASKLLPQNIILVSDYDAYLLMKERQIFPIDKSESAKIKKHRIKNAIFSAISKKKAKPYLFYGTLLILTSFIMPYSKFYIVIGTLLIVLALVCLCVKNKESNKLNLS